MVDSFATSPDSEEWDLPGLAAALGAMLNRAADLTAATFSGIDRQEELREKVAELVDETYDAREAELGDELMRIVERFVLLRTMDIHWVEHLTAMEELREGIYLRGYGQQDPLVAYKREAHAFFEEMSARIASGTAQQILRVSVKTAEQAEQEEPQQAQASETRGQAQPQRAFGGQSGNGRAAVATAAPPHTKLGRNDPCWCGSGKKFKKCHGR
jgi:preprotein translocase subunit SecA